MLTEHTITLKAVRVSQLEESAGQYQWSIAKRPKLSTSGGPYRVTVHLPVSVEKEPGSSESDSEENESEGFNPTHRARR